jgi:hypothetical protein
MRRIAGKTLGECRSPTFSSSQNSSLGSSSSSVKPLSLDLNWPSGLAFQQSGSTRYLYVSDTRHHRILRINLSKNTTTRIAGEGRDYDPAEMDCTDSEFINPRTADIGDGEDARKALLNEPGAIAVVDSQSLFVADTGNNRIRRVSLDTSPPIITTVAGTGSDGTLEFPPICDPAANPAEAIDPDSPPLPRFLTLAEPSALAARRDPAAGTTAGEATHIVFADGRLGIVWSLDLRKGLLAHVAGRGAEGVAPEGVDPRSARLSKVSCLAVDSGDSVYLADTGTNRAQVFWADFEALSSPANIRILDNGDPGTSSEGDWGTTGSSSSYGEDAARISGEEETYSYLFTNLQPGSYEVYAWWPASSSRSPQVPYSIITGSGAPATVPVDQRENGGQWNLLGTYTLGTVAIVQITARDDGDSYCADAVILRRVGA